MRARIVKINDRTVVIKGSNDKFATVAKSKLQFKYQLGDHITVEKDGDKLYFLPDDKKVVEKSKKPESHGRIDDSFLRDDKTSESDEIVDDSNKPLIAVIISIVLAFVGWFFAFYICLGGGVAALVYSFSTLKNDNKNRSLIITLQVISIIFWLVEFGVAMSGGYQ